MRGWIFRSCLVLLAALPATASARAESVADFYRGRTVTMLIGYSVAGGYDIYARVLGRYIGKHIPGNPSVVPQNMTGAGSLRAANYLYNVAAKDGTVFGIFGRGLAMEPLLGDSATQYDATKFTWLGSITNEISVCVSWYTSPVKTWDDLLKHQMTVAGQGSGSDPDIFPLVLKAIFDAKIKLISGYPGTNESSLAMERGEVDGRCGWSISSIESDQPSWIADKKLNFLVQLALTKSPKLPDTPLVMDLATTDRQRQILRLIFSRQVMGRPFAAPPGIPAERVAALRTAFDETMRDPEFLAEAQKERLEVNPVTGAEIDKLLADLYRTPPDIVTEARSAIQGAR
jgi:tripartite-type tricarboxylate transporter receptor subunit TctC